MITGTLRTATHVLALAAAVLWLALPAQAAEYDLIFNLAGKGTFKLKSAPTLKQDVELWIGTSGLVASGEWLAVDDDAVSYRGTYYVAHDNHRELGVVFGAESLAKLGQRLSAALLAEKGVSASVVSISLRPTALKIDGKWKKASCKLVFDVAAVVGGVYRIGTYEVPLKGEVTPNN
jgi:hypothetical protein